VQITLLTFLFIKHNETFKNHDSACCVSWCQAYPDSNQNDIINYNINKVTLSVSLLMCYLVLTNNLPYGANFWRGKILTNLRNFYQFVTRGPTPAEIPYTSIEIQNRNPRNLEILVEIFAWKSRKILYNTEYNAQLLSIIELLCITHYVYITLRSG